MPGNQPSNNQNGQRGTQNGTQQKPTLSWSTPADAKPTKPIVQVQPVVTSTAPKQSTLATPTAKSSVGKIIAWIVGVVVVIALIAWGLIALHNKNAAQVPGAATQNTTGTAGSALNPASDGIATSNPALTIPSPQAAGLQVAVSAVSVSVPTWVIVYEDINGKPGNALGAQLFTSAEHSGTVDLLRGTLSGQTYFVGEAHDTGDHVFSIKTDLPLRDQNGTQILVEFHTN